MNNFECSEATVQATKTVQPIITDAQFVPSSGVKEAIIERKLFPTLSNGLDNLEDDFSSAVTMMMMMIITVMAMTMTMTMTMTMITIMMMMMIITTVIKINYF